MMLLQILRDVVASSEADDQGSLMNAISAGADWLKTHEANQIRFADAIQRARDQHHVDGETELDDETLVCEGDDNGIYVSGWVWVDFTEEDGADA